MTPEVKAKFTEKLGHNPSEFFGRKVNAVVRTDGLKLICHDGARICYRLSVTVPVVQVYSEASTEQYLQKLSAAARQWIFE